jgi:PhnB protein
MANIAPWLSVRDAAEALTFYSAAFAAMELERLEDDEGQVIVAQLSVDGADFWIQTDAESSPEALNGLAVRMILTVDDPDPVFESAVAAGATEVTAVSEAYGWRIGRVADPFGHHWEVGRRLAL